MSRASCFFRREDDEWTCQYSALLSQLENKDIELAATILCFPKLRADLAADFLNEKFGLEGPYPFLKGDRPLTRSAKLMQISKKTRANNEEEETLGIDCFDNI